MIFRALTTTEEATFRRWARDHYKPGAEVRGVWHPVVQDECVRMNREHVQLIDEQDVTGPLSIPYAPYPE